MKCTIFPHDKLEWSLNQVKNLWPKRHDDFIRFQVRNQIQICKNIKAGKSERYQGKLLEESC